MFLAVFQKREVFFFQVADQITLFVPRHHVYEYQLRGYADAARVHGRLRRGLLRRQRSG